MLADKDVAAALVTHKSGAANVLSGVLGAHKRAIQIIAQADDKGWRTDGFQVVAVECGRNPGIVTQTRGPSLIGSICSSRVSARSRSAALAASITSTGVASTRLIARTRASLMADQKTKFEPTTRVRKTLLQCGDAGCRTWRSGGRQARGTSNTSAAQRSGCRIANCTDDVAPRPKRRRWPLLGRQARRAGTHRHRLALLAQASAGRGVPR